MSLDQDIISPHNDTSSARASEPPSPVSFMSTASQTAGSPSSSATSLLVPSFLSVSGSTSPSTDGSLPHPTLASIASTLPFNGEPSGFSASLAATTTEVDPQIMEALRGKDRIYVLKLGEMMENLLHERRPQLELQPATTYQRMLVHRCSAYYKLTPEVDPVAKTIHVRPTMESRIPARRICELAPAEETAHPAFKIMRRTDRRPKALSQAGSVAGEEADLSDVEPSETGSLGGRSAASSARKPMTIEEREVAYAAARSRIFMNFDEKGREKEKDMSASSSSLSLASGSSATGGGSSSIDDVDEVGSSPATESEWSGPSASREKKDGRRNMSTVPAASGSSRSLRSTAPSFHASGSTSSRNSRAGSPSPYASLYDPNVTMPPYDPSQHHAHPLPPNGYHHPVYMYPYPPNQPMTAPYMQPYGYYPQYGPYLSQPHPPQHSPDNIHQGGEVYPSAPPPPHPMNYGIPFSWPHPAPPPGQQPMPHMQHHPHPPLQHTQPPPPATAPLPPHQPNPIPQYSPYIPPGPYNQHVHGYYPPPPPQHMQSAPPPPPPPPQQQQVPPPRQLYEQGYMNSTSSVRPPLGNGVISLNAGRPNRTNTSENNSVKGRGGGVGLPPQNLQNRPWGNFSPGTGNNQLYTPGANGDVGPRFTPMRRGPGSNGTNSSSPSNNRPDDVSSTASSSTTSSSSRRTFTSSTSSSHHPLPARPDWAVGLKPHATHHQPHHRHTDRTLSPPSMPRNLNGNRSSQPQNASTPLQPTDFPPLTTVNLGPDKRPPTAAGAWGNPNARSSLFMPGPTFQNSALQTAPQSTHNTPLLRLEEPDQGFERPPPKSAELFNPKVRRPAMSTSNGRPNTGDKDNQRLNGEAVAVATATLVGQVAAMTIEDQGTSVSTAAVPSRENAVLTMAS